MVHDRCAWRRVSKTLAVVAILIVIQGLPGIVSAQTSQLVGMVTDTTGDPVASARMVLENEATGFQRETRTRDTGGYAFAALSAGTYRLRVEAQGFQQQVQRGVVINVAEVSELPITLEVAGVRDTVTVEAGSARIGSRDGSVGTVIERKFLERIPLSGRTFQPLLELTPGVTATAGGFAVNGQRPDTNYMTVDGVSANVGMGTGVGFANQGAGQTFGMDLVGGLGALASLDTVQEFRVQTSTYAPEYGRATGAQIAIVTRSGGNATHGDLGTSFRDDKTDATNWFVNYRGLTRPELSQAQFSGTLGGPIRKNRAFYFGAYEQLRLREPRVITGSVPSLALREMAAPALRPFFDAFPLPNGAQGPNLMSEYVTTVSHPTSAINGSARVDAALAPSLNVFAKYGHAPSERTTRTPSFDAVTDLVYNAVTVGVTHVINNSLMSEWRANYTDSQSDVVSRHVPRDGASAFPTQLVPAGLDPETSAFSVLPFTSAVSTGSGNRNRQQQWQAIGSLLWARGSHQIKMGVDYRYLFADVSAPTTEVLTLFSSQREIVDGIPTVTLLRRSSSIGGAFHSTALFAQDAWRAGRRLTLTYGIRWDVNPAPSFEAAHSPFAAAAFDDLAGLDLAPRGTALWQTRFGEIAPRLGVSYSLDPEGRTVLTGGGGVFYDLGTQASASLFNSGIYGATVTQTAIGLAFPTPDEAIASIPGFTGNPPYAGFIRLVDPDLRAPRTIHGNVRIEHQLGSHHSVSAGYTHASGERLFRTTIRRRPNARFTGDVGLIANDAQSEFNGFHAQYRGRAWAGLDALVSYSLGKAMDDVSLAIAGTAPDGLSSEWGPSDFDVRHTVTTAITWDIPSRPVGSRWHGAISGWSMDLLLRARTAPPFTVRTGRDSLGLGLQTVERPNVVPGVPIYLDDAGAPGRRRLNRDAFVPAAIGTQGDSGRNAYRLFGGTQADLAVRRVFSLGGPLRLQLRVSAFNLLNTANFSGVVDSLASPTFGLATTTLNEQLSSGGGLSPLYQWGGPRSIEFAARLTF